LVWGEAKLAEFYCAASTVPALQALVDERNSRAEASKGLFPARSAPRTLQDCLRVTHRSAHAVRSCLIVMQVQRTE
jgi:hypothetical protein